MKDIDRDGCVCNKQLRLHNDDTNIEGRTNYAESSDSADDGAMYSDADVTEMELQRPLPYY